MKTSSKAKYDLVMKMINEFTENEKCNIIMDMIEDIELDYGKSLKRPDLYIITKAHNVVFEK